MRESIYLDVLLLMEQSWYCFVVAGKEGLGMDLRRVMDHMMNTLALSNRCASEKCVDIWAYYIWSL